MSFIPGHTYHVRYKYSWPDAIRAEFWWQLEHIGYYRGGDGGLFGHVRSYAYKQRKAAERRGNR